MLEKIKRQLAEQKERRIEKRSKPWSKKQKIIFLLFFGAIVLYIVVSMLMSSENKIKGFSLPSLNLSVNGLDATLICLLVIGVLICKIRAYIKRRKGKGKEK